jgi:hypothetical protein
LSPRQPKHKSLKYSKMAKIKNKGSDAHTTKPKTINKRAFERVYWPYIPIVLAISLLVGLGTTNGNLQAYARHPGGRVLAYATSMSISSLLADTNASRAANGVASLSLNNQLNAAAQASADDMATRNYWSHNTPEGNPPWIWVTSQGYSYQKLGQNLATGFSDEQATINGWMNSAPHRENLLDSSFKEVGFGFANSPNYTSAGGGPMTIVVAFYGNPKVLAVSTPAPAAPAPVVKSTSPAPAAQVPAASQPAQPAPTAQSGPAEPVTSKKPAANTETPADQLNQPLKSSRIQLALTNTKMAPAATSATVGLALIIFGFWASRHLLAIRRFFLKGERYAIHHPLTDIGLLVIACLLFILSQTAGLIK